MFLPLAYSVLIVLFLVVHTPYTFVISLRSLFRCARFISNVLVLTHPNLHRNYANSIRSSQSFVQKSKAYRPTISNCMRRSDICKVIGKRPDRDHLYLNSILFLCHPVEMIWAHIGQDMKKLWTPLRHLEEGWVFCSTFRPFAFEIPRVANDLGIPRLIRVIMSGMLGHWAPPTLPVILLQFCHKAFSER